ncbi:MAG: T9SS type A sorting domain-containing protein [Bacteroidetes bacterium]|nr:T9SS type A sorting domain-containing protein [Bacteroidota bacterium]
MKTFCKTIFVFLLGMALSMSLNAQADFDFGDAPETAIAYPSLGVMGMFPTCMGVGSSWVQHNNFGAQLGPTFDFEPDGNAGLCPTFAPYDSDECFQDGDAGLLFPESYTIISNTVVPCPGFNGTTLGTTCTNAIWGGHIDIDVSNFMPSQTIGLMNVVMDFNQNGVWGDQVLCSGVSYPEHVLVDFPIPNPFAGPLSVLGPPGFMIGPNSGYVWARFTISELQVGADWDGHGFFEDGESEDYLLHISAGLQSDFGDAPEDVLAYPSNGVIGAFPTCITAGANGFVEHLANGADLGPSIDLELDGNAGLCPSFSPYDDDECFAGGDAGLLMPEPFTIVNSVVVTCPNSNGTSLGYPCDTAVWGANVDIDVNNFSITQADVFMNVLVDWSQNGVWGDTVYCPDVMVPEHVLQNFVVPINYSGPLSGLLPPDFVIGPEPGYFWCRFTISEMPVSVPWDGNGFFDDGETEDYLILVDTAAAGGEVEYGDAPDGVMAYPSNGVLGNFPTCVNVPATGFISHTNFGAILGPMVDFEPEGNAGLCPSFTPYDNDECFQDGDAGLLFPDPYTIQGGVVVLCPNSVGTSLGNVCTNAVWGTNLDIDVSNFMPGQTTGYLNVLFDWTRNGKWGDIAQCVGAQAPEHVLQNFVIPNGFTGPVSGLLPPNFLIGPNVGYVWARFTISEAMMPVNWDGHGSFEDGESEDYLIDVGSQPQPDAEYGDAPEGSMGYPSTGVLGTFPTCIGVGVANHYVIHHLDEMLFFGPMKDFETDGNAGLCSPYNVPYDNDECFVDGDAGLIVPPSYTIQLSGGTYSVVPCTAVTGLLDTICHIVRWGPEVDIDVTNWDTIDALVNVVMDFNHDGKWALDNTTQCSGTTVPEHVLVNFVVPGGYIGPLSGLNPPPFQAGPYVGYLWTRFTVSEQTVSVDWDGVGNFEKGESEDYLLYIDLGEGIGENPFDQDLNLQIFPNPTNNSCTITYDLQSSAAVSIGVYDIRGSLIRMLTDEQTATGHQTLIWDGANDGGQAVGSGIYIVKVSLDNVTVEREKVLMIR